MTDLTHLPAARRPRIAPRRRLVRDRSGATIVEFGIVILPFFAILFAILATSLSYFAQQSLETVAVTAGRSLLTGSSQGAALDRNQFKAKVCATLPRYMRCSNLFVSVDRSVDFASASIAAPAVTTNAAGTPSITTAYNMGAPGEIVTLQLYYVWQLPSVTLGYDISTLSGGRRLLIATAVSKTEQYS